MNREGFIRVSFMKKIRNIRVEVCLECTNVSSCSRRAASVSDMALSLPKFSHC